MFKLDDARVLTYVCAECGGTFDSEYEKSNHKGCNSNYNKFSRDDKDNMEYIFYIFNRNFMEKYTKYDNLRDFMAAGRLLPRNMDCLSYEIFKKISKLKLDRYVKRNTIFGSWDEMFEKASSRYLKL